MPSNEKSIELNDGEKKTILELWENDVLDVKILTEAIFPGKDGRSKEGVAVKSFLSSLGLTPRVSTDGLNLKRSIELTEDQKQFIETNAGMHKPVEITRLLFQNRKLTNLDAEGRAVMAYYNTLDPKMRFLQPEEEGGSEVGDYNAPRNVKEGVTKIKKYVFDLIDESKLSQARRDQIGYMIKFMNVHRFVHTINRLQISSERIMFESSFVRFVHDKPDLTEEDVDLYINVCGDIVSQGRMEEEENTLRSLLLEDDGEDDGKKKMNMATVEYLSQLRKDMNTNKARQERTLQSLTSKRSARVADKVKENASVLNLVEAWKIRETRIRLLKQQQLRKQLLKNEVDRLSTMDGVMLEIYGVGKEEALES